jgi:tetratricopeptide (TPR) repeat protein
MSNLLWNPILIAMEVDRNYLKGNPKHIPEWCKHTMDGNINSAEAERYKKIYGIGWIHMHHCCRGINLFFKAILESNYERKREYVTAAINDYNYVLKNTDEKFIARPEIFVRKGLALLSVNKDAEAVSCYIEATRLKPDYVPAYLSLTTYYYSKGEVQKARNIVVKGLEHVPDSEELKKILKEVERKK